MQEVDPAVVRAAAAGDLDAFSELVRAYQAPLWRYLRDVVGDAHLAEDLAQETFLRAYTHLGSFAFRSRFSTWLFTVAHNVAVDALRSRQRRNAIIDRLPAPGSVEPPAARSEIGAALQSLSPKLREAFVLVEVVGLSCSEAGAVLGIPAGTVKSRLFHARRHAVIWFRADSEAAQ